MEWSLMADADGYRSRAREHFELAAAWSAIDEGVAEAFQRVGEQDLAEAAKLGQQRT